MTPPRRIEGRHTKIAGDVGLPARCMPSTICLGVHFFDKRFQVPDEMFVEFVPVSSTSSVATDSRSVLTRNCPLERRRVTGAPNVPSFEIGPMMRVCCE